MITPRYYGGTDDNLTRLTPFEQTNFSDFFVAHFLQPHTMFKHKGVRCAGVTKGAPFCVCHASALPPRNLVTPLHPVEVFNLVVFDLEVRLDPIVWRYWSIPQLFFENIPYAYVAYVPAEHTPEFPRIRVVVAANSIPLERYPAATMCMRGLLGVRGVAREWVFRSRAVRLPSIFEGESHLFGYPIVSSNLFGRELEVEDIDKYLAGESK